MQSVVSFLASVKRFLEGKKTYIAATITILTALLHYLDGTQSFAQFLQSVAGTQLDLGVLAVTLRAALNKL